MAQSLDQLASVVEALQRRVETLEAAVRRLELLARSDASAPRPDDRTTPHDHLDVRLAQMQALDEYYRCEGVQQMAARPDLLAAFRAQRAKVNAYLDERGLPPQPDPYHALP